MDAAQHPTVTPFDDIVGTKIVELGADRVVATIDVSYRHQQGAGIVHGGVYATVIETTASMGANMWLDGRALAVGLSNHTDFLRSVSEGVLTVVATPVQRGRTLQLWRVEITDSQQRLVAEGKVRLMALEPRPPAQP